MKESVTLIKKTWGESIVGSASMAIVFVIVGVIAAVLVFATLFIGNAALFTVALALFIIFVIILAVVYAAMEGIFVTALYTYAKTGTVPSAFNRDLIQNAFVPEVIRALSIFHYSLSFLPIRHNLSDTMSMMRDAMGGRRASRNGGTVLPYP